jgi:DNA-binding SARP family transcriptional activator
MNPPLYFRVIQALSCFHYPAFSRTMREHAAEFLSMIGLRTLGSVALHGPDGREIEAVLRQPKRLALLVYLAVARPRGFQRRDTLLGLFWPELGEARARNALGQALHGLRSELGSGIIVSRGSGEVAVDRQRLWCDAAAFDDALDAADRERALELYRGDLLEGFYLTDAAEFERWLEEERTRLRRVAAQAATWLAETGGQGSDTQTAIRWAQRAATLSPYDESAVRRLVTLLDRAGDRAQALAEYETFARRLEQELEVAPSPETQALIDGVRTRTEPLFGTPPGLAISSPHMHAARVVTAEPKAAKAPNRVTTMFMVGAATILLALAVVAWFPRDRHVDTAIDPDLIMVAPFRVAADGSFEYLREGLVDLLVTGLTGETGSRAVDPRSSLVAWRRALGRDLDDLPAANAQGVARGLGAGQLLAGSVVGGPQWLTLDATLYDAVGGTVRTRVSAHGPADSLPALVDRLVKQLLARDADVPRHQIATLTTTSLPALRSYLEGVGGSRAGRLSEAVAHLDDALSHDSTFALAALHLWLTAGRGQLTSAPGTGDRALRLAHAARDRLSPPDRLLLEAITGPRYPAPSPRHELLAARTRALNASPDRPAALALMGVFHVNGIVRGEAGAQDRAIEHFSRALDLDSTYAVAAHALALARAIAGDTVAVQRIVQRYLASDSTSETAQLLEWLQVVTGGDERAIMGLRARMTGMHPTALGWIVAHAMLLGLDLDGAEAALAALHATARSEFERRSYLGRRWEYLGNRGRLDEMRVGLEAGARAVEAWGPIEVLGVSAEQRARYQHAIHVIRTQLFWAGDTTGIDNAAALLEDVYRRTPAPEGMLLAGPIIAESACFAGMARIAAGDVTRAHMAAARLRWLLDGPFELSARASHGSCAATLDAVIAVAARRPDARALAERADSVLRADPPVRIVASRMQLLLARAFDALDDPESALRVIRRREMNNPAFFLATILREEARLAARSGDRAGAIRAYSHYLELRSDPDAALMPEVQQIRRELAELRLNR